MARSARTTVKVQTWWGDYCLGIRYLCAGEVYVAGGPAADVVIPGLPASSTELVRGVSHGAVVSSRDGVQAAAERDRGLATGTDGPEPTEPVALGHGERTALQVGPCRLDVSVESTHSRHRWLGDVALPMPVAFGLAGVLSGLVLLALHYGVPVLGDSPECSWRHDVGIDHDSDGWCTDGYEILMLDHSAPAVRRVVAELDSEVLDPEAVEFCCERGRAESSDHEILYLHRPQLLCDWWSAAGCW